MIQNHVPDRERCEKLRAAGMPQDTEFVWAGIPPDCRTGWAVCWRWQTPSNYIMVAAPLATEMLKWLPAGIGADDIMMQKLDSWFPDSQRYCVSYDAFEYTSLEHSFAPTIKRDTLPNALADLLIWCVEQGHVKWEVKP